jgi:hypothetical protein
MRPSLGAEFKGAVEGRVHSDGRKIFKAVATTPALDRYGEVVLPRGASITNFLKNPVLLEIHNYSKTSIGRVTDIKITDDSMICEFVFSEDQRGKELQAKYEAGDMSAFSIGFNPISKVRLYQPWDDAPTDLSEITVDLPDGTKQTVNLRAYDQIPYVIHNNWDLLELSPVPVPANPEALLIRQANDIVRKAMALDPVSKSFVQEEVEQSLAPALALLEKFNAKFNSDSIKIEGAVPFESTKGVDVPWGSTDARVALIKWAAGAVAVELSVEEMKAKMNWAKFRKAYALLAGPADSYSSYMFLHHTVAEEELVCAWRGLTAAMAALLGDSDIEEKLKGEIYDHLSAHYKDFGKVAPDLKEYADELELGKIKDEPLVADVPTGEVAQPATSVASADQLESSSSASLEGVSELKSVLEGIAKKMTQMVTDVTEEMISLNLKMSMIEDYLSMKKPPVKAFEKPDVKKKEDEVLFEVSPECLGSLEKFVA